MKDADVDLMLRVKEGDEEAFRVLFRKRSPRVVQFVRRTSGRGYIGITRHMNLDSARRKQFDRDYLRWKSGRNIREGAGTE